MRHFCLLSVVAAILITKSAWAGDTVLIAKGASSQQPQQPQVAVNDDGSIHVVYGVGNEIRYCRSEDGGKAFSNPALLPAVHSLSLGMRRGPRITVSKTAICVTAIGGKQGKGRDGDILASRSTDGGKTWNGPTAVNEIEGSAREGLHAMAAGAGDALCCVWLDLRSGKTEIMASVSTDGGETWGKNTLVYRSPDGSVCECCHPSVAIDPKGKIVVLWRNSLAGARDMYLAASEDGGKTYSKAQKLGTGTWPLNACPMDGGAVSVDGAGKFVTTWRRDKAVFLFAEGNPEEQNLGPGEQPWVVATAEGPFAVWLKKRGEAALLLSPGKTDAVELAPHARDPVLAIAPSGRGPLVAAWETREGKESSIHCQVISMVK